MGIDVNTLVTILLSLTVALTLHEFAHAWVGNLLGDNTARREGRLSLNPLAHIDPLTTLALPLMLVILHSPVIFAAAKPVPFNPHMLKGGRWGAALVALAGPLTNLLLAVAFSAILWLVPMPNIWSSLLINMIVVNVGLGVFNLIPFPPLDGSRVVYAAFPPLRDIMDRIESLGIVAFFIIFFFGYQFIAPLISNVVMWILSLIVPGTVLP